MKYIYRIWKESSLLPKLLLIGYFLCSLVSRMLNTYTMKSISDGMNGLTSWWITIAIFTVVIFLSAAEGYIREIAKIKFRSENESLFREKVIDSDYEFFISKSCSKIWETGLFIGDASVAGINVAEALINLILMAYIFFMIGIIIGWPIIFIIVFYIIMIIIMKKIYKKIGSVNDSLQSDIHEYNQVVENSINGFAEVKIFGMRDSILKDVLTRLRDIYAVKSYKCKYMSECFYISDIIQKICMAIIIIASLYRISRNEILVSDAIIGIFYAEQALGSMFRMLDYMEMLAEYSIRGKDFYDMMDYQNTASINGVVDFESFDDSIKIEKLYFAYPGAKNNCITDLNMEIKKGEKVGICGSSGGSKSTLFKLLCRFYKIGSGKITIDNINISDYNTKSYSNMIGVVSQDINIFDGKLIDNIKYGSKDASMEDIRVACTKANLIDFIDSLENGFDTIVGNKGLMLSGGQKQRIALARVFLRDPEIILLDEATSALDNESEKIVQEAIELMNGKTVIAIAHRLSTIKDFDHIYMINGKNIEDGTFDQLISKKGEFYKMWNKA